jgi:hypothetical protein
MTKLFAIERAVRKTVFKSIWKFFGVKDLTDLAMFSLFAAVVIAVTIIVQQF